MASPNLQNIFRRQDPRIVNQMALTLGNQIEGSNKESFKRSFSYVKRYRDQLKLIRFRRVNGKINTRVVFRGMPPDYVFKTNYRIEYDGRTPYRDRAKVLSGKSEYDSVISSYDSRTTIRP